MLSQLIKKESSLSYVVLTILLIIAGIGISLYLSYSHYKVYTDIDYASFCAVSKAINCDTVSQSPYSVFLNLPVPLWGLLGYLLMVTFLVTLLDLKQKRIRGLILLMGLALIFCLISVWLGIISAIKIQSYCFMCVCLYAINFFLLYLFWLMKRRYGSERANYIKLKRKPLLLGFSVNLSLTLILVFTILPYWKMPPPKTDIILPTGVTQSGSPWIGAKNPEITIVEYADYQCFQCRKMHFFLRQLIETYPNKIRLVHKHFPMDKVVNPIVKEDLHPGSATLSRIAIHAVEADKFWKVSDYLFHYDMKQKAIFLKQIANDTGLDLNALKSGINSQSVKNQLLKDIFSGLKLGITGTPSYLIDNNVYTARIPPDILNRFRR